MNDFVALLIAVGSGAAAILAVDFLFLGAALLPGSPALAAGAPPILQLLAGVGGGLLAYRRASRSRRTA